MKRSGENIALAIAGAGIGFLNGFMGGGGGILVVSALLAILNVSQKEAHATAILVILPITVVSAIVYILNGSVDYLVTLFATIGVFLGGILGAKLLNKMNSKAVKAVFSFVMMAAGIRMFFG